MYKAFAGIGSRETPIIIMELMRSVAFALANNKWILRSGGAEGADFAFQHGVGIYCRQMEIQGSDRQEIFIPWNGFNKLHANKEQGIIYPIFNTPVLELARQYHPKFDSLSKGAKMLIARNGFQILGKDLNTPVKFVLAYTTDGSLGITTKDTGGTGQVLRIAYDKKIPIWNLGNKTHLIQIQEWLENNDDGSFFTNV